MTSVSIFKKIFFYHCLQRKLERCMILVIPSHLRSTAYRLVQHLTKRLEPTQVEQLSCASRLTNNTAGNANTLAYFAHLWQMRGKSYITLTLCQLFNAFYDNYDIKKLNNIKPTPEWSTLKVLHMGRLRRYIFKLQP